MEVTLNKSHSETDISNTEPNVVTPPNYGCYRNKRRREDDFKADMEDFKTEMKKMMTELFSTQKKELQNISATQKTIQESNLNIEKSIAFLVAQNEEFKKKIQSLESQVKEDKKHITLLENTIEDLQRDSRKSSLEIKNVPRLKQETKETLLNMVVCLANEVGCNLAKSDIKYIYRTRPKNDKSMNTPIIVESTSTLMKTELLKLCKNYNKNSKMKLCAKHLGLRSAGDTPIYTAEHLTTKASRLYFLARDLSKSKEYKYCWTAYGKVYVRKHDDSPIITILNEAQVQSLLQT